VTCSLLLIVYEPMFDQYGMSRIFHLPTLLQELQELQEVPVQR